MGEIRFDLSLQLKAVSSLSSLERRLLECISAIVERGVRRKPPFNDIDLQPLHSPHWFPYWGERYWNWLRPEERDRLMEDTVAVAKADVGGPLFFNQSASHNVEQFRSAILKWQRKHGLDDWCMEFGSQPIEDFDKRAIALDLLGSLGFEYNADTSKTIGTFAVHSKDSPECFLALHSDDTQVHAYVGIREPLFFCNLGDFFYEDLGPDANFENQFREAILGIAAVSKVVLGELEKASIE